MIGESCDAHNSIRERKRTGCRLSKWYIRFGEVVHNQGRCLGGVRAKDHIDIGSRSSNECRYLVSPH